MTRRAWGVTALIAGIVLLLAALILRFAIVPGMAQLPSDTDETRTYTGEMQSLLNAEALQTGDLQNLFITDVPVEISRHVFVEEVDGGDAIVVEEAQAQLADGTPVASSTDTYALDRKTMEHLDGSDDERVLDREGLVIGWPIGTDKTDYVGWSDDLQATVPLTFEGEEERAGLDTYVFESTVSPAPIEDEALLAQFPAGLPLETFTQLAGTIELSEAEQAAFAQILPTLPDPVPFTYLYSGTTTYWVEPTTGVVVDIARDEMRQAAITPEGVPMPLPVATVFDWVYTQSDASVADAVADAEDGMSQLGLFGTTIPLIAGLLGLVLIAGGILLMRRSAIVIPDEPASSDKPRSTSKSATG